jgi:predicted RNA binding protein YcfA (HicA-like mRNA interferase family)
LAGAFLRPDKQETLVPNCYLHVLLIRVILKIDRRKQMKSYSSREIIKLIEANGWYYIGANGSHHYYKHSTKSGKVTVPHPRDGFPSKTQKNILTSAGLLDF